MLSLAKKRDFVLITKYGRWVNGRALDIKYLYLPGLKKEYLPKKVLTGPSGSVDNFVKQLLVAFVAGIKISKKAVERNRVKRRAREVIRLLAKEKIFAPGFYLMVMPKKSVLTEDFINVIQETKLLLQRIKVI